MALVTLDLSDNYTTVTVRQGDGEVSLEFVETNQFTKSLAHVFISREQLESIINQGIAVLNPASGMIPEGQSDTGSFGKAKVDLSGS